MVGYCNRTGLRREELTRSERADNLSDRTRQALAAQSATPRDVENLRQWVNGFACISDLETAYLTYEDDLIALGLADPDGFLTWLAHKVEDALVWMSGMLGWVSLFPSSRRHFLGMHRARKV